LLSFSEALHRELKPRGVRVTALCPGPVPSEFRDRAGGKPGRYPAVFVQSAEEVAALGYRGLKAGRRLVVPGVANRLLTMLMRFVPRSMLVVLSGRRNLDRQA